LVIDKVIREEEFLDITLHLKTYKSSYSSLEESLKGYTEFERLERENKYFCEECAKKVDAEKGVTIGYKEIIGLSC